MGHCMHLRALRMRGTGTGRRLAAFGLALLPVAAAQAQAPAIEHKAVSCIVAERFSRLDACFAPAEQVARARVQFRAHGTPHWYFVDMGAEGPCHSGVLPKPKKSTRKIDYYIDVVDRRFAEGRTREHAPRASYSDCLRKRTSLVATTGVCEASAKPTAACKYSSSPPRPVRCNSR